MPGKIWDPAEIAELKRQLNSGILPNDIRLPNRGVNAIRNQLTRLGLIGDGVSRRPWSTEEKRELRQCLRSGWKPKDIVEARQSGIDFFPGRNINAIRKQIQRMNLGNSKRSRRAKNAIRLTEAQQEAFCAFLHEHYVSRTPEEIAKLWNKEHTPPVTPHRVVYYLVREKIKLPRSAIVKMPYSRAKAKRRRKSKRVVAAQRKRWQAYWKRKEELLGRSAQARREAAQAAGETLTEHRCPPRIVNGVEVGCGRIWPAESPYFAIRLKKTAKGIKRSVGRLCALCEAAARRTARR